MKLKPPQPASSPTAAYNKLQREAADRVTQRYEEQRRKDRRRALAAKVKSFFSIVFLLALAGGGFYAWQNGMIDNWLGRGDVAPASPKRAESPALAVADEKSNELPIDVNAQNRDVRDKNIDAYSEVMRLFRSAKVDYWKNALESDRPGKAGGPRKFWCLVMGENGGPAILELLMSGDSKMKVRRLSASSGTVDSSETEFGQLTSRNPYLIMREGRAYFAVKGKGRLSAAIPAPQKGKTLNPGQIEFGSLYEIFKTMKIPSPGFVYDVEFEVKGGTPVLKIATVRFGEEVSYDQFFNKVAGHYGLSEGEAMAIDAVLKMGRVKIASSNMQGK